MKPGMTIPWISKRQSLIESKPSPPPPVRIKCIKSKRLIKDSEGSIFWQFLLRKIREKN